jgi:hypothetical protein
MAEDPSTEPVAVTAEERRHPAYRLLARAALALARVRNPAETKPDVPARKPGNPEEVVDD